MTTKTFRNILGGLIVTTAIAAGAASYADEPLKIQLNGRYYAEPATVPIMVVVRPADENRVLRVEADGENFFRSADVTLNGESEPKYHTLWFKNLPAGDYVVRATVLGAKNEVAMAEAPLVVMSGR